MDFLLDAGAACRPCAPDHIEKRIIKERKGRNTDRVSPDQRRQEYFGRLIRLLADIDGRIGMMDDIETRWPGIKTFSLPTIRDDQPGLSGAARYRLEFGLKAEGAACALLSQAWAYAEQALRQLGASEITPLND